MYRKHRDTLKPTTHNTTPEHAVVPEFQDDINPGSECVLSESSNVKPHPHVCGAKFLLKTREQYHIYQASLNKIAADIKGLWTSMESSKENIETLIAQEVRGINVDAILQCIILLHLWMGWKLSTNTILQSIFTTLLVVKPVTVNNHT